MSIELKYNIQRLGFLVVFAIIFMSCNSKSKQDTSGVDEIELTESGVITITKSQFESSNMELGNLVIHEFNTTVKANGMFDALPENKATVSTYFAGYVKNITLLPGDKVKKGQVLFTLENPEYINVQQKFLESKSRLDYLKADYERQKTLLVDHVTSKKNFLKAESEYRVTSTQYQSLQKELSLMNINHGKLSGESITSTINVLSPISGTVTSINASKGVFLNPSDIALTVINTEQLHLELKIFEKDLPLVKEGQQINIYLQNNSNKVYKGVVHLINRSINAENRTIDIHADLVNEEDNKLFAPGMYVETEILTSSNSYDALPSEAIINIEASYFALVRIDENTYKKVPIEIGTTSNGFTQILNADDFSPDTLFMTKGAFNLISE